MADKPKPYASCSCGWVAYAVDNTLGQALVDLSCPICGHSDRLTFHRGAAAVAHYQRMAKIPKFLLPTTQRRLSHVEEQKPIKPQA